MDALGINCGLGPRQMLPILKEICRHASIPVIVKPNAGLPKQRGQETYYDVTPELFAGWMQEIVKAGLYRGRLLWYDAGAYPQDDGYLQKYGRTEADREGGDGGFFLWTGRDFG